MFRYNSSSLKKNFYFFLETNPSLYNLLFFSFTLRSFFYRLFLKSNSFEPFPPCIHDRIRISSVPCVCPFHSPLIFSSFHFLCFESPASITSSWHGNAISSSFVFAHLFITLPFFLPFVCVSVLLFHFSFYHWQFSFSFWLPSHYTERFCNFYLV